MEGCTAPPPPPHTHARTHAHAHTHTRARAHTHTHTHRVVRLVQVYRRYSQLLGLHQSILQKTKLTPEELGFPAKVMFGARSDKVVEERRIAFIQ
jgi:hypothetical protein